MRAFLAAGPRAPARECRSIARVARPGCPESLAPILLRTVDLPPSQPIRKLQAIEIRSPLSTSRRTATTPSPSCVKSSNTGAVEHADAWLGRSVREQYGLEINLIDPVRRLRSRPRCVRPLDCAVALGPRGDADAAEFDPRRRRAGGDVVRIVRRKPGSTQLCGDAEAAEDLHRAG